MEDEGLPTGEQHGRRRSGDFEKREVSRFRVKANRDLVRYHFEQFGRQIGVVGNSGLRTTIQMGLLLMLFLLTA